MKLFTTKQIAELDRFTIENEPVSDLDLMERASLQITNWIVRNCSNEQVLYCFRVGPLMGVTLLLLGTRGVITVTISIICGTWSMRINW